MKLLSLRKSALVLAAGGCLILWPMLAPQAAAADAENGKKIYEEKCVRCHGDGGKGDGPMAEFLERKPGDFTDKARANQFTDEELKKIVVEGKAPMPGYKDQISDTDIDDVIAYIRSLSGK
jgi:mono/diheme cytochrome c family protein